MLLKEALEYGYKRTEMFSTVAVCFLATAFCSYLPVKGFLLETEGKEGTFAFASYYGNHMVLQRGPQRANIWGYSPTLGDKVTVTLAGHSVSTTVVRGHVNKGGVWSVKLPAMTDHSSHTIKAVSSSGTIHLYDVLFGDVWICSGQSNMQVSMSMVINSSAEIADADHYPNIRVFTVRDRASPHAETDLVKIWKHWAVASRASIGGPNWNYFSAVCWFYGKYLYRHRKYPIGLIASDWGASRIEPWMSREGLAKCNVHVPDHIVIKPPTPGKFYVPTEPTVMWNAMMGPFTKMTIYGAIWYQGESNSDHPTAYSCLFPAMIEDWRHKFHTDSGGETSAKFPFGFVQLAALGDDTRIGKFPRLRWAQTAEYGYAPNPKMDKVFMAVSADLPDYHSPFGAIHPRYKQDVGLRLGLGAQAVAYGVHNVKYQGPFPTSIHVNKGAGIVTVEFDNGHTPIDVRNNNGFQVCCSKTVGVKCQESDHEWKSVQISAHRTSSVDLPYHHNCGDGAHIQGVRYAWRESPCDLKKCAIYGRDTGLPAPPYLSVKFYA